MSYIINSKAEAAKLYLSAFVNERTEAAFVELGIKKEHNPDQSSARIGLAAWRQNLERIMNGEEIPFMGHLKQSHIESLKFIQEKIDDAKKQNNAEEEAKHKYLLEKAKRSLAEIYCIEEN